MKLRPRVYYSAEQKTLMWDRWQAGDSLHEIARLFDRGHSAIQGVLSETGKSAMRPCLSARSANSSCQLERCEAGAICTAVTLYSGQLVAQSLYSVVTTFAPVSGL